MKSKIELPIDQCPACQVPLQFSENILESNNVKPQENDIAVCKFCSSVLVFDKNLKLQNLSSDDYQKLDEQTRADIFFLQSQIRLQKAN